MLRSGLSSLLFVPDVISGLWKASTECNEFAFLKHWRKTRAGVVTNFEAGQLVLDAIEYLHREAGDHEAADFLWFNIIEGKGLAECLSMPWSEYYRISRLPMEEYLKITRFQ